MLDKLLDRETNACLGYFRLLSLECLLNIPGFLISTYLLIPVHTPSSGVIYFILRTQPITFHYEKVIISRI